MPEQFTVRTFNVRRGRMSPTAHERLHTLGPRWLLPPGPLDLRACFGRIAPLVLEIGCGYGQAAIGYARSHPTHDLIAVDVHSPGISRLLGDVAEAGLTNVRAYIGDARLLLADGLAEDSLTAVHLFFPDPWPKQRHHKRRLVGASGCDLLASRLRPGGRVLFATDSDDYATSAEQVFDGHPDFEVAHHQRPGWRPVDGYEAKGRAAGRQIHELCVVRRQQRS